MEQGRSFKALVISDNQDILDAAYLTLPSDPYKSDRYPSKCVLNGSTLNTMSFGCILTHRNLYCVYSIFKNG